MVESTGKESTGEGGASSSAPASSPGSPDASGSSAGRTEPSPRGYGSGVRRMRPSIKELFDQVQARLDSVSNHGSELPDPDNISDRRVSALFSQVQARQARLDSLSQRRSSGSIDGSDHSATMSNLAPWGRKEGRTSYGPDPLQGILGPLRESDKGGADSYYDTDDGPVREGSVGGLEYDHENDKETLSERIGYVCGRMTYGCVSGCRSIKTGCTSRPGLILALVVVAIVGSVLGVVLTTKDFADAWYNQIGGGKDVVEEGAANGGAGVKEVQSEQQQQPGSPAAPASSSSSTTLGDMTLTVADEEKSSLGQVPFTKDATVGLRFVRIKDRILESGVSTPDVLEWTDLSEEESITPQYRALAWISLEDPMDLDVQDEFLLQRYALASFWFSTHQSTKVGEWIKSGNWMSGRGICLWHGVSCRRRPGATHSEAQAVRYDANNGVTALDLTDNRVSGTVLPELFRALTDVRHLDLSRNYLAGTLHDDIEKMTQLQSLDVSHNLLKGEVPTTVGNLKRLESLRIHGNKIRGTVPSEVCLLTEGYILTDLTADCAGVRPQVSCSCCSECFNGLTMEAGTVEEKKEEEVGSLRL